MYLPLAIFFAWVEGVTWAMTATLKRERAELAVAGEPGKREAARV